MIYMATVTVLLLGLNAIAGVRAQGTASLALPADEFSGLPLSGEIAGTGSDGTTYVVSASGTEAGDIPFTITLVQDATHVSGALSLATGLGADVACGYNTAGVGACTLILDTATDAAPQTVVSSGTIPMFAVPVTTATRGAGGTSATQPSASGSASTTGSSSGSATSSSDSSSVASAPFHGVATIGLTAVLAMLMGAYFTV